MPDRYPRLLRRVRAALIDSVIFIAIICVWFWSFGVLENAHAALKVGLLVLAYLIVEPGFVSVTGGTIGHHLMGLRVRDAAKDQPLGFCRATIRGLARSILGILSLLFMFVTRRHQAIHDYFSRSTVVLDHPEFLAASEQFQERVRGL
jgi:uncharacterized RDD family membrane protein YckC